LLLPSFPQSVGAWNTDGIEELKKLPEAIVTHEIQPMGEVVRLTMTESPDYMVEGTVRLPGIAPRSRTRPKNSDTATPTKPDR
jgi:hypothetical protein